MWMRGEVGRGGGAGRDMLLLLLVVMGWRRRKRERMEVEMRRREEKYMRVGESHLVVHRRQGGTRVLRRRIGMKGRLCGGKCYIGKFIKRFQSWGG